MLCIKNGTIHDAIHREPFQGDILVENGKIMAIGENLETGADAEIVDAQGLHVYPGFVEAHGHIGLDGYGIGYEGMDYNEVNDIVTPHLRGIDGGKAHGCGVSQGGRGRRHLCLRGAGKRQRAGRYLYHHQDGGKTGG